MKRTLFNNNIAVSLLLCLLLSFSACSAEESNGHPVFYFLDVGQGDCTLIRTREGDILIDAGPESSQERLCARLQDMGIEEIRLAIFSHPDEDHLGGADGILDCFAVEEVWYNGQDETHDTALAFKKALERAGITPHAVQEGDKTCIGGMYIFAFTPFYADDLEGNEGSIILKLSYGEISAIFSGDAEAKAEERLLTEYNPKLLDCDLYKVGHHGSYTSSGEAFVKALSPRYAVISCGAENSYGHPHGVVLERLERNGAEILRTDLLGEIVFITDGHTLERKT